MLKQLLILTSFILFAYYFLPNVKGIGEMILFWNYSANFSSSSDVARDVAVDSNNNIIVVGYDDNTTGSYAEWRIMKFDQNRNLLWSKEFDFNLTDNDFANSVAVDSQNNIIVVGSDRVPGNNQWRIMKLNSTGDPIWSDYIDPSDTTGNEEASGVAVDSADNIIVIGHDNLPGNLQWRIRKLDQDKNLLWEKLFDISTFDDKAYGVAVDGNDNMIVVGSDRAATSIQWRIMKLNSNGNSIWNYTNNISATTDEAQDVAVDSLSNIIVVGYDRNTTPASDQWRIMKLNSLDGYHIWNYSVNPTSGIYSDKALGVAVDSNNNIIVVGYDRNTTGNNEQWRIMKFDTSGVSLWNDTRDISTNLDRAYGVVNASNNNIIAVGYDYLPGNFQWRIMEFTLCGNGYLDSTSGEMCEYKTSISNPHPDSPCQTNQYCNNICRCSDLFNVWLEPNQMLFTISEKTPINLYIKNTGYYTDTYYIQSKPSNPSVIDVDITGSSPTNPVSTGTTELVRPWVTVFATTSSGTIMFNVTSTANPEKYTTATLNILEGLPISLFEFDVLGLLLIIILAGFIYFLLNYKN